MADDPITPDTDPDPELERRLTGLGRLRDDVAPPPPVHELTAQVRQRRTRRFALASTAAAAAAVIAGILVLASRPDGNHDVTAAEPPTTEAPSTATTLDGSTDSTACGQRLPTDTLGAHDVVLSHPRANAPGMLTLRLTNRGTDAISVETTQAVVVDAVDGRIASQRGALVDQEPVHRTVPAGKAILVDFHVADGACAPNAEPHALRATPIIELTTPDGSGPTSAPEPRLVRGHEIDVPLAIGGSTSPTTAAPSTTVVVPTSVPTSVVPTPTTQASTCAPTPTVAPQPVDRPTTTAPSFEATRCYPPPTAPPTTMPR
jgi:hypothetical protein